MIEIRLIDKIGNESLTEIKKCEVTHISKAGKAVKLSDKGTKEYRANKVRPWHHSVGSPTAPDSFKPTTEGEVNSPTSSASMQVSSASPSAPDHRLYRLALFIEERTHMALLRYDHFKMRIWRKTMPGKGYVKEHIGTSTIWRKGTQESHDGTNTFQTEGIEELEDDATNPTPPPHPFPGFCHECPDYWSQRYYPRSCWHADRPQCIFGRIAKLLKRIFREG